MEVTPPGGAPDPATSRVDRRSGRTARPSPDTGPSDADVPDRTSTAPGERVSPGSVGVAVAGFAVALFGVYWDDAWHTDRGRDDLFSAPHLVLYAGVAVAVGVVGWWGWRRRSPRGRQLARGPIGVAIAGSAATLGSAPIDEWWHEAFGRDAVLWSPPHLVAVVGTIALGTGVTLVAGTSAGPGWSATALTVATGAGVVGAWQVLVLEYDTDVAQFSPGWYLPVLAVAVAASSATMHAALGQRLRWAAGWAGLAYTLAMIGVIMVLAVSDFSRPIVPAVLPALIVTDVARHRRWTLPTRSALIVVTLFGFYVPYLRWVDGGVPPSTSEIVWGAAIAIFGVAAVLAVFDPAAGWLPPTRSAILTAAILMSAGLIVAAGGGRAHAHDPGQGPPVAEITLTAEVLDGRVRVVATPDGSGADIEPVRLVARRAGRSAVGVLSREGPAWTGAIELDETGRWFVYVEARRWAELLEAWLPVTVGSDETTTKRTELYVRRVDTGPTATQVIAGLLLVAVAVGIVGRTAAAIRASNAGGVRSAVAGSAGRHGSVTGT